MRDEYPPFRLDQGGTDGDERRPSAAPSRSRRRRHQPAPTERSGGTAGQRRAHRRRDHRRNRRVRPARRGLRADGRRPHAARRRRASSCLRTRTFATSSYAIVSGERRPRHERRGVGLDTFLGTVRVRAKRRATASSSASAAPPRSMRYLEGRRARRRHRFRRAATTSGARAGGAPRGPPTDESRSGQSLAYGTGSRRSTGSQKTASGASSLMNADASRGVSSDMSIGAGARLGALDRHRDARRRAGSSPPVRRSRSPRRRVAAGDVALQPVEPDRGDRRLHVRGHARRARSPRSSVSASSSRRSSSRTRSGSTSSASASTTGPTSPSRRLPSCWPRRRRGRSASGSRARSPSSARTTRSASSSSSRRVDLPLRRPRGDHGRPRLVHRVVPALRLRPPRLRPACSSGSSRSSSTSATRDTRRPATACIRVPVQEPLPVWVAVGGTPESAVRAGMLGLPMALAIIGGLPERFRRSPSSIAAPRPRRADEPSAH